MARIKVLVWIATNLLKEKKKKKKTGNPVNISRSLLWRNPEIRSEDPAL